MPYKINTSLKQTQSGHLLLKTVSYLLISALVKQETSPQQHLIPKFYISEKLSLAPHNRPSAYKYHLHFKKWFCGC